ncbi:MAG: sulfatase-like hydrolase/transferase [Gammaproteobacteria bacterium]|nr:sulfatase-like hydrolase/transferase [Gammaproteobacteria bacterium]MCY4357533.1 sulfatase-like hydrolase/transferase [Gammaproteobacteria bacterium]
MLTALLLINTTGPAIAQIMLPNFVVVMADDLGYGDLGLTGSQLIRTPNLDRLAQNGAHLNSFYSCANVCTVTRGGLLNGQYPIHLNLVSDVARPTNIVHLKANEITSA